MTNTADSSAHAERGSRCVRSRLPQPPSARRHRVPPLDGAPGRDGDRPTPAEAERAHIERVLESGQWNKKHAAGVLAISRGTLYRKLEEDGLQATHSAAGRTTVRS